MKKPIILAGAPPISQSTIDSIKKLEERMNKVEKKPVMRMKLMMAYIKLLELRTSDDITAEEFEVINEASDVIFDRLTIKEWDEITDMLDRGEK